MDPKLDLLTPDFFSVSKSGPPLSGSGALNPRLHIRGGLGGFRLSHLAQAGEALVVSALV